MPITAREFHRGRRDSFDAWLNRVREDHDEAAAMELAAEAELARQDSLQRWLTLSVLGEAAYRVYGASGRVYELVQGRCYALDGFARRVASTCYRTDATDAHPADLLWAMRVQLQFNEAEVLRWDTWRNEEQVDPPVIRDYAAQVAAARPRQGMMPLLALPDGRALHLDGFHIDQATMRDVFAGIRRQARAFGVPGA